MVKQKVFGLWSAVFLGIGSMVGAGIFVLLGEAGAIGFISMLIPNQNRTRYLNSNKLCFIKLNFKSSLSR